MKRQFKSINFKPEKLGMIDDCNAIVRRYQAQGLRLTLRQLYYQLVTTNAITNAERSYKNLGNLVSDARLAGLGEGIMQYLIDYIDSGLIDATTMEGPAELPGNVLFKIKAIDKLSETKTGALADDQRGPPYFHSVIHHPETNKAIAKGDLSLADMPPELRGQWLGFQDGLLAWVARQKGL
jgi:hypothetical protein